MDIGILLRGKSLDKLPLIYDKFNHCFLVNDWKCELDLFEKYIKNKQVDVFCNILQDAMLTKKQYIDLNIDKVHFSFTKKMMKDRKKSNGIIKTYEQYGISNTIFLDQKYESITKGIRNTGVCCIFYVAEVLKPKNIWLVGLDFYREHYLVQTNVKKGIGYRLEKAKKIKLVDSFLNIVKNHPNIQFHIGTYYKDLPKLNNLKLF